MTPEELLKALAEKDRELQAPPMVEAKLKAAFREKYGTKAQRRKRRAWLWIPVAAAAAIAALVTVAMLNRSKPDQHQALTPKPADRAVAVQAPQPMPEAVRQRETAPAIATARPAVQRHAQQPREVVTGFFPLVEDAPPISEGAELVRVNLPVSAMRDVGLPVREDRVNDRVQADVLMNYGMATAVRFVSYQK